MRYSVAEAKNNLPKLIDRVLAGGEVTITRRGEVVASLKAEKPMVGQQVDLEWLRANQLILPKSAELDWGAAVREMRDEDV